MTPYSLSTKPRLAAYVLSRGRRLPSDFFEYSEFRLNSHLCVFCKEPLNRDKAQEIYVYKGDEYHSASFTGTYCCDSCYPAVRALEEELAQEQGQAALFPHSAMERIDAYTVSGLFDDTVHDHIQRLVKKPMYDKCYFCKEEAGVKHLLDVPYSPGLLLVNGGKVRVCESCYSLQLKQVYPSDFYCVEICYECQGAYYIDEAEESYRKLNYMEEEHLCPDCLELIDDVEIHLPENLESRVRALYNQPSKLERWTFGLCEWCGDAVNVDRALHPRRLAARSFGDNKLTCDRCMIPHPTEPDVFIAPIKALKDDDCVFLVYNLHDMPFFSLRSTDNTVNVSNCSIHGYTAANYLLRYPEIKEKYLGNNLFGK